MKDAILHAPMIHRITKNLTPDEESMIAAAEMPVKQPITDALLGIKYVITKDSDWDNNFYL